MRVASNKGELDASNLAEVAPGAMFASLLESSAFTMSQTKDSNVTPA